MNDPAALAAVAYALIQFLFAPLLGALSDRYGRRPGIASGSTDGTRSGRPGGLLACGTAADDAR
jgi:MFS family permease